MKIRCCIFIVFPFLLSCQTGSKKKAVECVSIKELTKLEQLYLLPFDSVMNVCDLSNDSIVDFPDLSAYSIKTLDLSDNLLDTIISCFLPKSLEKLNLSHNRYSGHVRIEKNTIPTLRELDMSFNALDRIDIGEPICRILLSYNDLRFVSFNHKNIQYLDISYNCNMSERVGFEPLDVDTIVREGVAGGKRLLGPMSGSFDYHY